MNFGTKYYFGDFLMRKINPAIEISEYIILMLKISVTLITSEITTTETKTTEAKTTAETAKNGG